MYARIPQQYQTERMRGFVGHHRAERVSETGDRGRDHARAVVRVRGCEEGRIAGAGAEGAPLDPTRFVEDIGPRPLLFGWLLHGCEKLPDPQGIV